MSMGEKKWMKVLALSMSLPSTIFGTAWIAKLAVDQGYASKPVAFGIFFLVIINIFYWIVWHAIKNKNKS